MEIKERYMSKRKYDELTVKGEVKDNELYIICDKDMLEHKLQLLYEDAKKTKEMIDNYEE